MQLTDEQKKKVAEWLDEGVKLSDIQSRIGTEFSVKLTYMEVRFLIDDLKLQVKDPVVEAPPEPPAPTAGAVPGDPALPAEAEPMPPDGVPAGPSAVKITTDTLARPGTMVSGGVTFSDGQKATWYLDQMGRLGLASETKGYRPSQEDLMDFQASLQNEMAKMGF
jgi:hypothetical protein